ncbi:Histone-lysine N-methyltransferase, H3 lysine-9 specific SUVH5 [Dichanthelium oligosanthes]|uniref:Histone-lysine N-methyltransferase, H3 lysine-9 specific SUVH5 n=1 Tax=Dichanthelium oligosanthes TaxID=888268 RepID=A0A1E5V4D5_9POAL|nr:Histone-lysine N-methyltransferase, H3 lysine-9 specific SUVH5 [Dichanthelium oligosanthes]
MEPPAPPAEAAAGLSPRRLRPRRACARRSWPDGCGRSPAPPPVAAAGDGLKGADGGAGVLGGRVDEVVAAPAAVSPPAQNASLLQQQGSGKVDEAAASAAISPVAQHGALPQQQGLDKVEAALASAQNGAPPRRGHNKVDELVAPAAVSPVACNDALQRTLLEPGLEKAGEDGDRGENGEAQLLGDAVVPPLDGQQWNRVVKVVAPAVSGPDSYGTVGSGSSAQNGGEGCGLLVAGREVGREEVTGDGDVMVMGNRAGAGELERKENGVAGSKMKRQLTSAVNSPPKKRAAAAICKFPPGCKRTAVTTKGNGVSEVSPVRTVPIVCGRAVVTTTDSGVLEVSTIRTFPPSFQRSAFTITDSGDEEGMPLEATPITNGDASVEIPLSGGATSPTLAVEVSNEKLEGKRMLDEGHSKAHSKVQVPDDFVGTKQDGNLQRNIDANSTPRNSSDEKMKGKLAQREGKLVARVVVDDKMKNKIGGSLHRTTLKTPLSDPIDAKTKGKRLESDKMNAVLIGKAVIGNARGKMQSKTLGTKKEAACSNVNTEQNKFARKPNKFGKYVSTNQIEESDDMNPDQLIVLALMAPDKCPWAQRRKSIASAVKSLAPRNKLNGKDVTLRKLLAEKAASHESINDETMEDDDDSNTEDDNNSDALVMSGEKLEVCVTVPPSIPSGSHHRQLGDHDVNARSKVRKLLQLFQAACRKITQLVEQGNHNFGRVDQEAIKALKKDSIYNKPGAMVGNIPGVEVGDEFHFRVELSMVGLHRPPQGGIDTSKVNGVSVAISVVASGGYPDELSSSHELIYTGSGGKASGNKQGDDQKLERGNLALKNCIDTKTPVRVIHGFKGQSRSEVGHSKGKQTRTFIYDGLYQVVECWQEGPKGEMVFKYRLQRIAGQPELSLHAVKATRKSIVREGLCLPDISQGSERIPICVINTIDDMRPAPFRYTTKVIYPTWYEKEPPKGCDCTNGCSDSITCACAVKNGGEIPFNSNGAIVEARPLIYECGPSCSFICEYAGELLEDKEAEKRQNDEYLFDIGSNYHDEELWEGLKSVVGVQSFTSSSETMEGFTIDAAECSNVGRFINHGCSPNLYAQNVLWDHGDMRMPHVMLFAVENIPPLQELTYHYNYTVGHVRDENGKEKVKYCYCGASDCCGRLY